MLKFISFLVYFVKLNVFVFFYKANHQRQIPVQISRRIPSPSQNSIQLDSLPPSYDTVKDIDPNLPSYESIM